jgi:mono/diheme cytochrome c family protein
MTATPSRNSQSQPLEPPRSTTAHWLGAAIGAAMCWASTATPLYAQVGISTPASGPIKEQGRPLGPAFGKREFESNCASCHGVTGRGGGPLVSYLSKSPPDLTQLSKNNAGVFPIARVYDVIEGGSVPAHGTRDMPVWGQDYRVQAATYFMELPYDPEVYVRTRILALAEYLSRIQAR